MKMQSTDVTSIVVVVVTVAVALTSSVNCADGIRHELLPLPSETSHLRAEMLQMLRQDTMATRLEPHEMLEELARLRATAPGLYERAFYREMHKLGEEGTEACNTLTMRYIYEIVSLSDQHNDLPALANFINFLKFYGKPKFAECAATTEDLFNEKISGGQNGMNRAILKNIENELDLFFMAYAGSKRVLDDTELYELAKKVDLTKDEFKVNRALKVANNFRLGKGEAAPEEILMEFLSNSCASLQRPLNVVFGIYNIADALDAQLPSALPIHFLKFNAYNRICVAFQTEKGKEGARANMVRQMPAGDGSSSSGKTSNSESNTNSSKWFKMF